MTEASENSAYSLPLVELVEKIVVKGAMTPHDQETIRRCATQPLDSIDIRAIRRLTELIREGSVKVV